MKTDRSWFHVIVIGALIGIVILTIFTVLVHWSWNSFAPEVFGLSELDFQGALGMVIFLSVIALIFRYRGWRRLKHRHMTEHRHARG